MKLILFDIDGTLVDTGGAGITSLNKAFFDTFSVEDAFHGMSLAGKTDPQIIKEALRVHQINPNCENISILLEKYIAHLKQEIHIHDGRLKPGVLELIEELSKSHHIGLLTGNIEYGAKIKLTAYGIYNHFLTGAFGCDNDDRNKLLPIACNKFNENYALDFLYADCVVIGDTPRDVCCSKLYGAMAIAVATGPYTTAELSKTAADLVVNNLLDVDYIIKSIL
ncbi:MAG: HAD hydrolase-like protein [Candidatus Magnetoovum sp. WYHC-5]|nr:HAD hydrolase-like protein [Candidatus Magnetoovum sp. WYHC-5]